MAALQVAAPQGTVPVVPGIAPDEELLLELTPLDDAPTPLEDELTPLDDEPAVPEEDPRKDPDDDPG